MNPRDYEILKIWALGREKSKDKLPWYRTALSPPASTSPPEYFKRVVIALRLKKDHKLVLKSFKEVPINSLEMLLPTGKIKMKKWDKFSLGFSTFAAVGSVLLKYLSYMAHVPVPQLVYVTALFTVLGVRTLFAYSGRRNKYLAELNRMLYFKNIANNRSLLASLVDRAEDESFKEALLTYSYLLSQRPLSARESDDNYYVNVQKEIGNRI